MPAEPEPGTWAEALPWLRRFGPGDSRELDRAVGTPGWWFTHTPSESSAGDTEESTCYVIASVLLTCWPEDRQLAGAFPTVPGDTRLGTLAIGSRARSLLRAIGADTVAELGRSTLSELLDVRYIGRHTVLDLLAALIDVAAEPVDVPISEVGTDAVISVGAGEQESHEPDTAGELIDGWLDELDTRDVLILTARFFAEEPATLEAVGREHRITRERVRQIERNTHNELYRRMMASSVISSLLESVRDEIQPVAAMQRLLGEFPELNEPVPTVGKPLWFVLDKLDDYFEVVDGWALAPSVRVTRERTQLLLEDLTDRHGVVRLSEVNETLGEFHISGQELRSWLEWCQYPILDGHVLTKASSHADKAAALLSISGDPLQQDEIAERIGVTTSRGLGSALSDDERFKRVDRDTWSLREWEFEEYTDLRDQIGRVVDARAGSVPLRELIGELTARSRGISESSIETYAAAPPFETRNGLVSRSRSASGRVARKASAQTKRLFRHEDGWAYRVVVNSEHQRGSGSAVPVGLASAIGLTSGEVAEFHSEVGLQAVRWTRNQPQLASIRRFLEHHEIDVGATVFLHFSDDHEFSLRSATKPADGVTGVRKALWLVGMPDTAVEEAERALATAIQLPGDTDRNTIRRSYRHRGDDDIANALEHEWGTE